MALLVLSVVPRVYRLIIPEQPEHLHPLETSHRSRTNDLAKEACPGSAISSGHLPGSAPSALGVVEITLAYTTRAS